MHNLALFPADFAALFTLKVPAATPGLNAPTIREMRTPTMVLTGESDRRTPIAESEELYFALKAQKIPAVLVRVPREFHGIHVYYRHDIDKVEYVPAWMEKWTQ